MEHFYDSYTKVVQDQTYYFVKRYLRFPEYSQVADILEGYGMHTDFGKACRIAGIKDAAIIQQVYEKLNSNIAYAKVIELNQGNFESKSAII